MPSDWAPVDVDLLDGDGIKIIVYYDERLCSCDYMSNLVRIWPLTIAYDKVDELASKPQKDVDPDQEPTASDVGNYLLKNYRRSAILSKITKPNKAHGQTYFWESSLYPQRF